MSSRRVLLVDSSGRAGLAVCRSLGSKGITVDIGRLGVPTIAEKSAFASSVFRLGDPREDGVQSIIQTMRELLTQHRYDLLIPITDGACEICSLGRSIIEERAKVALPMDSSYEYSHNKEMTLEVASQLDVPIPKYETLHKLSDIRRFYSLNYFPCYLKPIYSAKIIDNRLATFRVKKICRPEELEEYCRAHLGSVPLMVQEVCGGIGAGIYLLADKGKILSIVQQIRLHEPELGGGSSYRMTAEIDPCLQDYAQRIIATINWTGVAMIEFKGTPGTSEWKLMEINGRFWGSLALTISSGLDFPLWLYQLYNEKPIAASMKTPTIDFRQRNLKKDLGWLLKTLRASENKLKTFLSWVRDFKYVLLANEKFDSEQLRDPLPAIYDWLYLLRPLFHGARRRIWKERCKFRYSRQKKTLLGEMQRILQQESRNLLFVCKGNIIRSPFAEQYCKQRYGIRAVSSVGVLPRSNRMVPLLAEEIAKETFGIDLTGHRSTILDEATARWADLIFVMDYSNLAELWKHHYPYKPVLLLGDVDHQGEIQDPHPYLASDGESRVYSTYKSIAFSIDELHLDDV